MVLRLGFFYEDVGSSIVWVLSCGSWCGSFGGLQVGGVENGNGLC